MGIILINKSEKIMVLINKKLNPKAGLYKYFFKKKLIR